MNNLYHLNPKAYTEGYEILNLLSQSDKNKIPIDIWKFIEEHMDLNYKISFSNINNNVLLKDTNLLLAILYKTYLATDEEKRIISAKEKTIIQKREQEASIKYNPNNLFKKY